jgi:ribose transport system permease protein
MSSSILNPEASEPEGPDAPITLADRWRAQLASTPVLLPMIVLVLLFGAGMIFISDFASRANIDSILVLSTFLGIAAAGQTLVIILGGIDLSVSSTIGMGEVFTTVEYKDGMSIVEILVILFALSLVIGLLNGWISSYFRVHPLIVTLGIGFVISGVVLIATNGGAAQGTSPAIFTTMSSPGSTIGPIPVPPVVLVWIGVAAAVLLVQRRSRLGHELYALGSSPDAATLALARRKTVWFFAYALSAMAGLLTGVLLSGFSGGADFGSGTPYLFNTVAAVVVGGTSLLGGAGGYGRTIIGSIIIIEITSLLVGWGFSSALQETLLGAFIVLVAGLAGREAHVSARI